MATHKILVVGGGFGGVKAALELSKHDDFQITLLSNDMDMSYYPTFYHTATGGLREQSYIPIKRILAKPIEDKQVRFVLGTAQSIDRTTKTIHSSDGRKYKYDTLIMALGNVTNFFGIKGLDKHSFSIKSKQEITRFKQHLHDQLTDDRKPELNYVIVGGGPTGIELAGALPEYIRTIRKNHNLRRRKIHIDLVETSPRLLPRCTKATSRAVQKRLRQLGVKLYLKSAVQGQDANSLIVNGKTIQSHTVVWTAGVSNNPFFKDNGFTLDPRGKVVVDEHLKAEPNIYILGDNASTQYSGMAQTALMNAELVATNLIREREGKALQADKPKLPVTIVPVGPNWAAVEWGKVHFSGKSGWLLRSAADWIGFMDIESIVPATEQWFTEFGSYEECPTCSVALMPKPAYQS